MDFNFQHLHPVFKSLQSSVTPVTPDMSKQRHDFPEIHFMTIKAAQSGGKFQLEAPWGGILDRVGCVDFTIAGYLKPGMTVCVRYSQVDRNDCYIRNLGPATTAGPSTIIPPEPPTPIILALWSQPEGSPGLAFFAPSNIINPDGASSVVFGTPLAEGSPFFGICVNAAGVIIVAQMGRDVGNTFWETMRLAYIDTTSPTGPTYVNTPITGSPVNPTGVTFIDGTGNFALIVNPVDRQLFVRDATAFCQITLAGLPVDLSLATIAVSPLGYLVIPQYVKHGADFYGSKLFGDRATVYTEVVTDYAHKINAWEAKSTPSVRPALWSVDIGASVGYMHKIIFGCSGYAQRMPCSEDGNTFVAWVSAAKLIEPSDGMEMLDGYRYFNTADPDVVWGYRKNISRELQAQVVGVGADSGIISWTHTILATATAPVQDAGLLAPIEDFFGTIPLTWFDVPCSYGGRAIHMRHVSLVNNPFSAVSTYPVFTPVNYPDTHIFTSAAIIGLPLPTANKTIPTEIAGNLHTMDVFRTWTAITTEGYFPHDCRITRDAEGSYYFAYLVPEVYAAPGYLTRDGVGEKDYIEWTGLLNFCWDFEGDPVTAVIQYHTPGHINCYRRHLRKISRDGTLMVSAEILQLLTAAWYSRTDRIAVVLGDSTVVGGDSSSGLPMADNVWGLYPCGSVVFVLLDYHDAGAGCAPASKLEIRSSVDLGLLHTVELRTNDDLTAAIVYGRVTDEFVGIGDGIETVFHLAEPMSAIIRATLDYSIETGFTAGVDTIIFDAPPDPDVEIRVSYDNNTPEHYVGSRRYQVDGTQLAIRTGVKDAGEWALIWITEEDITTRAISNRTLLVGLEAGNPAGALTQTNPVYSPANNSVVSNGYILEDVYVGIHFISSVG